MSGWAAANGATIDGVKSFTLPSSISRIQAGSIGNPSGDFVFYAVFDSDDIGKTIKLAYYDVTLGGWNQGTDITIDANGRAERTISTGSNIVGNVAFYGKSTSESYTIKYCQFEQGSYPTSYIKTTGSSVTRLADSCYKTGVADWIGQTEGTLFVEASTLVNGADGRITISDGTINNRVSIEWDIDADTIKGFIGVGGNVSTTSHDQTDRNKIALVYSTSFAKLFVNGTLVATDTSSIPTMSGMAHIEYSNYGGTTPFVGNLYQTIVIPTALTDADAITLTTI